MKLVIGLGNPGSKYERTRHNVGFEVIAELVRRHGGNATQTKFQALVDDVIAGSERLLLVRPQTYMNRSGGSVVQFRDFYKLANDQMLVIADDFNLPCGRLRVRANGSAGEARRA
jgi:PTH1 family peptidyl-tRNA hydrolase